MKVHEEKRKILNWEFKEYDIDAFFVNSKFKEFNFSERQGKEMFTIHSIKFLKAIHQALNEFFAYEDLDKQLDQVLDDLDKPLDEEEY